MKYLVGIIKFYQTGTTEDDHHQIHIIETILTEIDGCSQMFRCPRTDNINRITDSGTRIQFGFQLISDRAFQTRNIQTPLG